MKNSFRSTSILVALSMSASAASAGTILLTEFDFGPAVYQEMEDALEANGHTVDRVNARTGGAIASALQTGIYDQLFLFDLTSRAYINQDDIDEISNFFGDHNNIVQDSRSYGLINTTNTLKPVEWQLINNVAEQFDLRGGGMWVGTDHDPNWTRNANPVLENLGFNAITGSFSDAVNSFDPASELLTGITATDLWAQGASVGSVSLGIQPNGVDMRFHFGHSSNSSGAIPYISANFGDFVAPDEDRDEPPRDEPDVPVDVVPLPAAGWMLIAGLGGLAAMRRRKQKST